MRKSIIILSVIFWTHMASRAQQFTVYNHEQTPVSFEVETIDSIKFDSADPHELPFSQLMQAYSHLDQLEHRLENVEYSLYNVYFDESTGHATNILDLYNKHRLQADSLAFLADSVNHLTTDLLSLRHLLNRAGEHINDAHQRIDSVAGHVDTAMHLLSHSNQRIDSVGLRLDSESLRMDTIGHHLSQTILRVDSLETNATAKLDSLSTLLDPISHLSATLPARLDSTFASIAGRMAQTDSIAAQLLAARQKADEMHKLLASRIDSVGQRIDNLEQRINNIDILLASLQADLVSLRESGADYTQTGAGANLVQRDVVTGQSYKIVVSNGVLTAQPIEYKNIAVIGNSFTLNATSPGVWWSNRGMAASTEQTQFAHYLEEATGAHIHKIGAWDFEANYSTAYNFSQNIPIDDDYDCVIVQINENAHYRTNMQESWEALYDYIRSQLPAAAVFQLSGWYEPQRFKAISQAARNKGVPFVNCTVPTMTGNFSTGDYVTGDDGQYHPIEISAVGRHPSDMGMLLIANRLLDAMGLSPLQKAHNIKLQDPQGTLSVPYGEWPEGGIVSVRCTPQEGRQPAACSITTNTGQTLEATRRTNNFFDGTDHDYFTFVMPDADVTVTVSWE